MKIEINQGGVGGAEEEEATPDMRDLEEKEKEEIKLEARVNISTDLA